MTIDAQAIVEPGAVVGEGCYVAAFAVVKKCVELGINVSVDHHAIIGGLPQDLHFDGTTQSGVKIGANTVIREGVTINRATRPGGTTATGENCYLMANAHLGHDVVIGDRVILANGVLLAGHIQVQDHVFLGGGSVFHQHLRIGEGAIVQGGSRMSLDIPPFVMASGYNTVSGLNMVGLKRRGFSVEEIADVKASYKAVYFHSGDPVKKAFAAVESGLGSTSRGRQFLDFFIQNKRRYIRSLRERAS